MHCPHCNMTFDFKYQRDRHERDRKRTGKCSKAKPVHRPERPPIDHWTLCDVEFWT